jgi:hypothetical protein
MNKINFSLWIARICLVVVVVCLLFVVHQANASGCKHSRCPEPTPQPEPDTVVINNTEYVYIKKDNENWKYVLIGVVATCAVVSMWKGRWCWEDHPKDELPNPGPALKITPNNLSDGVRLSQ